MNTDLIERLRKIAHEAVLPAGRAKQLQSLAVHCAEIGLRDYAKELVQEVRKVYSTDWDVEDRIGVLCGMAEALLLCDEQEQGTQILNEAFVARGDGTEKRLKRSTVTYLLVRASEAFGWHDRADDLLNSVLDEPFRTVMITTLATGAARDGRFKRAIEFAFWEFAREKRQQLLVQIALASLAPKFSDAERALVANALEEACA